MLHRVSEAKSLLSEVLGYVQCKVHKQSQVKSRIQRQMQAARPEFLPLVFPDPSPPTNTGGRGQETVKNSGRAVGN